MEKLIKRDLVKYSLAIQNTSDLRVQITKLTRWFNSSPFT